MDSVLALIKLAKQQHWTTLDLGYYGIKKLPDSLFELDKLETLHLGETHEEWSSPTNEFIPAPSTNEEQAGYDDENCLYLLPDALKNLASLRKLSVQFPYADTDTQAAQIHQSMIAIGQLKSLQSLEISGTFSSDDCQPLAQLSQLKQLHITNNRELEEPQLNLRTISGLSQLTHFTLFDEVDNITGLETLSSLIYLSIGSERLQRLTLLSALTSLEILHLHHVSVYKLQPLSALQQLRVFSINSIYLADVSPLAQCKNLQDLTLYCSELGDVSVLAALPELRQLNIHQVLAGLADFRLSHLAGFKQLTHLHVAIESQMDEDGNIMIEETFAESDAWGFSDEVATLSALVQLTHLTLKNIAIPDRAFLAPLTQLQVVNLDT